MNFSTTDNRFFLTYYYRIKSGLLVYCYNSDFSKMDLALQVLLVIVET